jgi:membrane protein DedA with SNARE-associated domain
MVPMEQEQEVRPRWSKKEIVIGILAVLATIGLCAAGIYYKDEIMSTDYVVRFGLLGVLIVAFVAGSTFSVTAIPVPYWLVVLTLPGILAPQWGILSPVWVGLMAALGASLGQLITFMIGYGGRGISERITSKINSRFYDRAMNWAQRHGSWAVFLMSAAINPLHLPMTIAIAALGYPPHKFFIFCFLGVALKSLIIAFCGYFGLTSIFSWLGV